MVTIIICTLQKDLKYKSNFPVIIVCPYHKQDTNNIIYFKDYGQGMAIARNTPLNSIDSEYICYVGDDNQLSDKEILKAIKYLEDNNHIGVSFQTRYKNPKGYLQKCLNMRYEYRFSPGIKNVIGTPFLFKSDILKKYKFDVNCTYSDDTDLCKRLRKDGYTVAYSDAICYEKSYRSSLKEIIDRFIIYGKSDKTFYQKYSPEWNIFRKIKSWLHPLTAEFIPKIYYLPFYLFCVILRYIGYIK